MGINPSYFKGEDLPVEKVTWYDAKMYCEKSGKRLPEEWEWEKAVRADTSSAFYWRDGSPDLYARHKGNANKKTHPVGLKKTMPLIISIWQETCGSGLFPTTKVGGR